MAGNKLKIARSHCDFFDKPRPRVTPRPTGHGTRTNPELGEEAIPLARRVPYFAILFGGVDLPPILAAGDKLNIASVS